MMPTGGNPSEPVSESAWQLIEVMSTALSAGSAREHVSFSKGCRNSATRKAG